MGFEFRPTKFQQAVLHLLVFVSLLWLLWMTGFREYWGFWQSPEVYGFLKHEYPQWFQDYIRLCYLPFTWMTSGLLGCWLCVNVVELRRGLGKRGSFYFRLFLLLLQVFLFGLVMGVRSSNNLIGWLDQGRLHGMTPLQVRE